MSIPPHCSLAISGPRGSEVLTPISLRGHEGLSRPFHFTIELVSTSPSTVLFSNIVDHPVTITIGRFPLEQRYVNGIVSRLVRGESDVRATHYELEIVPRLWRLSQVTRSRIFQRLTVIDILKDTLSGLDVSYEITYNFTAWDHCSQYRETDLAFASRLMEEMGLYYYFVHTADRHTMVVADSLSSHRDIPGTTVLTYDEVRGGIRDSENITYWQKEQVITSGKYTLWDQSLQLPEKHLEAEKAAANFVRIGHDKHRLKSEATERYEYPGGYAKRYDAVGKFGEDKNGELRAIFSDKERMVAIRQQEEVCQSVVLKAGSVRRAITAGHKFALTNHPVDNGRYVITEVIHTCQPVPAEDGSMGLSYANCFSCIPIGLPYRPSRVTPLPMVAGPLIAVVVGPVGEEIFTDGTGRVKVQFPWDRDGNRDLNSSCWIPVAQGIAGSGWGSMVVPRVGQKVIVEFEDGDPDKAVITGCLYDGNHNTPYPLPEKKAVTGIKSHSIGGGGGYSELAIDDSPGKERVIVRAERELVITVGQDHRLKVGGNEVVEVEHNQKVSIENDRAVSVRGSDGLILGGDEVITAAGMVQIISGASIELKVGSSTITITPSGINFSAFKIVMAEGAG
jgi:type VI secretion system secreted protein VgrG